MRGKRELISDLCAATGATWLLEHIPHRPVLMVLNYHRIGDKDATEYDPGLFSCTAQEFDWQIGYLKSRFRMATLDEVTGLLSGADRLTEPSYPVLRAPREGASAWRETRHSPGA